MDILSALLRRIQILRRVAPDEKLSRYAFSRGDLRAQGVTPRLFLLPEGHRGLSVFRTGGLEQTAIWRLGLSLAKGRGRNLHGRAEIEGGCVRAVDLCPVPTWPPRRHVELRSWPTEKDAQLSVAQRLAANARPFRFTASDTGDL